MYKSENFMSQSNCEDTIDEEYRNILRCMKPQLQCITDKDKLKMYFIWMDRLDRCSPDEKALRNDYANLMATHITRSKTLLAPFTRYPPQTGKLTPLKKKKKKYLFLNESTVNESSTNDSSKEIPPDSPSIYSPEPNLIRTRSNPEMISKSKEDCCYTSQECEKSNMEDIDGRPMTSSRSYKNIQNTFAGNNEDSQRSDFNNTQNYTDTERSSIGSIHSRNFEPKHFDAAFKRRLAEMHVIYELRTRNLSEKIKLANVLNNKLRGQFATMRKQYYEHNMERDKTVEGLLKENQELKERFQTMDRRNFGKTSLQTNSGYTDEYIEELTQQLKNVQIKNKMFQENISQLEEKLSQIVQEKDHEMSLLREKYENNIQSINNYNQEKHSQIVSEYNRKINETEQIYKEKIKSFEETYNDNIQKIMDDNDKLFNDFRDSTNKFLQEKDDQILHLQTLINGQCAELNSEVSHLRNQQSGDSCGNYICIENREKIGKLEVDLAKMTKSKNKYRKYVESNLFDLLKEKHLQESTVKMLLMKQRAEVTEQIFNESQTELQETVLRLQERYNSIINSMKEQISHSKDDFMNIEKEEKWFKHTSNQQSKMDMEYDST